MQTRTMRTEETIAKQMEAECLAMRARLLSRSLTSIYDEALRPLGITSGQLHIIAFVTRNGSSSPSEIARRMRMEKSTVSRTIERIRGNGWLSVSAQGSGRRQVLEVLPAGRELLQRARPLWRDAQRRANAVLGELGADAVHRAAEALLPR